METPWTDATIRQLRELWAEGHETSEIGRRMNMSRNAIIGKAHRLDLPSRPSPIKRTENPSRKIVIPKHILETTEAQRSEIHNMLAAGKGVCDAAAAVGIPREWVSRICPPGNRPVIARNVVPAPPKPAPVTLRAFEPPRHIPARATVQPVLFRQRGQCMYLIGDEKPWRQCEGRIVKGSYCQEHALRCYHVRGETAA